jgi:hypothetical protein
LRAWRCHQAAATATSIVLAAEQLLMQLGLLALDEVGSLARQQVQAM